MLRLQVKSAKQKDEPQCSCYLNERLSSNWTNERLEIGSGDTHVVMLLYAQPTHSHADTWTKGFRWSQQKNVLSACISAIFNEHRTSLGTTIPYDNT